MQETKVEDGLFWSRKAPDYKWTLDGIKGLRAMNEAAAMYEVLGKLIPLADMVGMYDDYGPEIDDTIAIKEARTILERINSAGSN